MKAMNACFGRRSFSDLTRQESFSSRFFYVGLNFALHCVQEQHDLVPSQFCRVPSDIGIYNSSVYYQYTEFVSKTISIVLRTLIRRTRHPERMLLLKVSTVSSSC